MTALAETRRILGSDCAAEDAAQEALIRAWRLASTCADPQRPEPWVRTIARREALRVVDKRAPVVDIEAVCSLDEGPPDADHERALDVRIAARRHLAPEDRLLLHYRYWQGMSDSEISDRAGVPVGTVKTRLHRARERLRAADAASPSTGTACRTPERP